MQACWLEGHRQLGGIATGQVFKEFWTFPHYGAHDKLVSTLHIELLD